MAKIKSFRVDGSVLLRGETVCKATAAKTVNYTPEQESKLLADYAEGVTVESLAIAFGKSTRSIVAKLSRMGVYKKKEYTTKTGEAPVKKETLADELTALADLTEAEADSLTKANKTALVKIVALLKAAQ